MKSASVQDGCQLLRAKCFGRNVILECVLFVGAGSGVNLGGIQTLLDGIRFLQEVPGSALSFVLKGREKYMA